MEKKKKNLRDIDKIKPNKKVITLNDYFVPPSRESVRKSVIALLSAHRDDYTEKDIEELTDAFMSLASMPE